MAPTLGLGWSDIRNLTIVNDETKTLISKMSQKNESFDFSPLKSKTKEL